MKHTEEITIGEEKLEVIGELCNEDGEHSFDIEKIKHKGRDIMNLLFELSALYPQSKTMFFPSDSNLRFQIKENNKWKDIDIISKEVQLSEDDIIHKVLELVNEKLNNQIYQNNDSD